jgi:hypothetical protein
LRSSAVFSSASCCSAIGALRLWLPLSALARSSTFWTVAPLATFAVAPVSDGAALAEPNVRGTIANSAASRPIRTILVPRMNPPGRRPRRRVRRERAHRRKVFHHESHDRDDCHIPGLRQVKVV